MADNGSDQSQPKTHEPTPRKLEQAREQGDIVQSKDLHTFGLYLIVAVVMLAAAKPLLHGIGRAVMGPIWHADHADALRNIPDYAALVRSVLGSLGPYWLALMVVLMIGPLMSIIAQRAFVVAGTNIQPKLNRISPLNGIKQKFGVKGLVEFLKSLVKLSAVVGITAAVLVPFITAAPAYTGVAIGYLGGILHGELQAMVFGVLGLYAIIALLDYFWQRHLYMQKHRMTRKDMEDEQKQTEGNPHMKGRRRDRAVAIASNRMLFDTRTASVLIVNPEHYAIALKWERHQGGAPVCIAKGMDHMAMALRKVARAHQVPIFRDPPLARMLHSIMDLSDEVDEQHYQAVAVAIRFALHVQRQQRAAMMAAGVGAKTDA